MDTYRNPFNPGAGVSPPELAGRADVLEQAITALERVKRGRHAKSLMVLGLRGVGKTVVLNKISKQADERGYLVELVEARDGDSLKQMLIHTLRKLLQIQSFDPIIQQSKLQRAGISFDFQKPYRLLYIRMDRFATLKEQNGSDVLTTPNTGDSMWFRAEAKQGFCPRKN